MKSRIAFILIFVIIGLSLHSQDLKEWHLKDNTLYNLHSTNTEKAYKELLKQRNSEPVIVAVIDSGVDAEHEDLKNVLWVNTGEIPENNIDDDGNGYIDDVHGWNFIGGTDGQHVHHDTYEATRLYKKYKYKYETALPGRLNDDQLEEYHTYLKVKDDVESNLVKSKSALDKTEMEANMVITVLDSLITFMERDSANIEMLDSLDIPANSAAHVGRLVVKSLEDTGMELDDIPSLRADIKKDALENLDRYSNKVKYSYNVDYDPRPIVGDNYDDLDDTNYGNNDIEGPDAKHGTHVAGIIAADRKNDIGTKGVADHVQIMGVRVVPDGDERDKDVANAIRYAVDNGAQVINMSFGKGYSPNKKYVDDALRYAEKHDVLMVHGAGNSSMNVDSTSNFPNDDYEDNGWFLCRRDKAKNWIEVGALSDFNGENSIAPFSNYGKEDVDIFSPGMSIYSTIPDDNYEFLQGTSMAAPVVAGTAALLRSYFPSLKAEQVKEILMISSRKESEKVLKPGTEDLVHYYDISVSGGILDTYNAVKLALRTKGKKKVKKKETKA